LTSVLPDQPFGLAAARAKPWVEESSHSMRSLAYFIGTFAVALVLGIGSAWYTIEEGSPLTTTKVGPWASWNALGNPQADPYTMAHLARIGRLPLTSTVARYFVAKTDTAGHGLTSACEYLIVGLPINARWWSVALYDASGSLIDNPSNRYSFNSEEALRHADGSYRIHVARTARPENWLPSGDDTDGNLVLMLRIYSPRETDSDGVGLVPDDRLPKIERVSCE
jgi:hypothetical protein